MPKKPESSLYLAYGSNLCIADMKHRCPSATLRGSAMIENARLVFRGVADVVCQIGYRVPVGVWRISANDEAYLDRYEGVAAGTYVKYDISFSKNETALIYFMTSTGVYPPSQRYVDVIRQGYRDFGLDERYLNAAIRHAFARKDPCEQTIARRKRQIESGEHRQLVTVDDAVI